MHYLHSKAWHQARMQALARKQRGYIMNPYRYATGGGSDPDFASVVSLLHFGGVHLSNTFTDQIVARTWTPAGGADIRTTESVFGGSAGFFPGSGGLISTPSHADWDFGSGNFTLEGRARFDSTASNACVIAKPSTVNNYSPWMVYRSTTSLVLYMSSAGASWDIANAVTIGTVAATTWYGWAISRVGTSIYALLDGTVGSTTTSSAALYSHADPVTMGAFDAAAVYMNGYEDEFRATKGVGRYSGNYTLAASAFPDS